MWRLRAGGRRSLTHSGGPGSPSGPTTGVCHSCWLDVALVNGGKPSGSAECGALPFARKNGPGDRNRHDGASKGVSAASDVRRSGHYAAALYPSRAFRRFISLIARETPGTATHALEARARTARGRLASPAHGLHHHRHGRSHAPQSHASAVRVGKFHRTAADFSGLSSTSPVTARCGNLHAGLCTHDIRRGADGQTTRRTVCNPRQALRRSRCIGSRRQLRN